MPVIMTVGEKLYLVQKKRERRRRIWRGLFSAIAIIGSLPIFAYGFLGWLSPDPIVINWPLCYGGLAVAFLSWLALKVLWL